MIKRSVFLLTFLLLVFSSQTAVAGWRDYLPKPLAKVYDEVKKGGSKVAEEVKDVVSEAGDEFQSIADGGEEVLEGSAQAVGHTVSTAVNLVEATGNFVTGDTDSARRALDRAEDNGHDAVVYTGRVAETVGKASLEVTIGIPILLGTTLSDEILGTNLRRSYTGRRQRISREVRKGSQKVGVVLEASIQPENLGKVALVYAASTVGGPMGAAMANVLYDKFVLKHDMSEREMLKSLAIGAAAGYAAEGMQGYSAGKAAMNSYQHASYLSKMASSVTHNLVTDGGNILLNDQSYSSKDFFVSLATGVSSVEVGNNAASQIFESTLEGGFKTMATMAVESDLDLSEIDFDQVELAVYRGFANGVTQEAVHSLMDATLVGAIPNEWHRADKKVLKKLGEAFYQVLVSLELVKVEQQKETMRQMEGLNVPSIKKQLKRLLPLGVDASQLTWPEIMSIGTMGKPGQYQRVMDQLVFEREVAAFVNRLQERMALNREQIYREPQMVVMTALTALVLASTVYDVYQSSETAPMVLPSGRELEQGNLNSVGFPLIELVTYSFTAVNAGMKLGRAAKVAISAKSLSSDGKIFFEKSKDLIVHYSKHARGIKSSLNLDSLSTKQYVGYARQVIKEGRYVKSINAHIKKVVKIDGKSRYLITGLKNNGKNISTFHVKRPKDMQRLLEKSGSNLSLDSLE
jgi:hypothetical protein